MRDDRFGSSRTDQNGVEGLMTSLEPFIEYFGVEQRSRESAQEESRVGFPTKEPTPRSGGGTLVGPPKLAEGERRRGVVRNLLGIGPKRDVLNW